MVLDNKASNWLVAGSTRGCVALWDMRFQICLKNWTLKDKSSIHAMSLALANHKRLGITSDANSAGPLIYVSSQNGETGLWEVATGRCHQVFFPFLFSAHRIYIAMSDNDISWTPNSAFVLVDSAKSQWAQTVYSVLNCGKQVNCKLFPCWTHDLTLPDLSQVKSFSWSQCYQFFKWRLKNAWLASDGVQKAYNSSMQKQESLLRCRSSRQCLLSVNKICQMLLKRLTANP